MSIRPRRPFRLVAARADEDDLHLQVAKMLTIAIGPPGIASRHGVIWRSVEMRNAASVIEGKRRKDRGCCAGHEDIEVIDRGRLISIELKTADGEASRSQKDMHIELRRIGVPVRICRSPDSVLEALRELDVPLSARLAA